ncbi:hypothetical protein QTP88_015710 [Uroleucon formosanum]
MTRSYSNINTSRNGNKNINKNNSSASTSRIQSVSSDTVFENSDLDVLNPAQISQKSGRNLSSSSDVPSNKIVKTSEKNIFSSSNRYSLLTVDDNCDIGNPPQHSANEVPDEIIEPVKPPPSPPPIIVNGINDFVWLRSELIKLIDSENFLFKSSTNNLKIITKNSDSYRSVVKFLNDQGAEYHAYQQRENKAFRIVIRNIHPSTPTNEVGIAIQEIGFTVRQVVNVRHKITKLALPIFFVDLEPAEINKDVFHVTHILHTKIKIEEPHKRRELVQCFNCQKYGHSKTYCSHPLRCIGCTANHPSSSCNKTKDQPPTCALCGGNHPANYRGCTVHKDLQKLKNGPKTTIKYNVKEGKASADKIPSDPPSFNLNDDKIFPNLAQTHPQNLPKSSNPNPNWHTHNTPPENNLTSQLSSFITELKSEVEQFLNSVGNTSLIGGDFNSKHPQWGCRVENTRGRMFKNVLQNKRYTVISPPGPTYWPSHRNRHPDILDLFLSTIPRHIISTIKNLDYPACDHSPVFLQLNGKITLNPPRPTLAKGPVNWDLFSENLQNSTNLKISLKTNEQIEEAVQNLTTSIQTAVYNSSFKTNIPVENSILKNSLPLHIQELIKTKRRARARWQRYNLPSDKRILNNLTNTIKKLIQQHKSTFFQEKYESLNTKNGSLWKTTKNILQIKECSTPLNCPNGQLAISDSDKAETFGNHLSKTFTPHSNIKPELEYLDEINNYLNSPLPMSLPAKHTTPNEVKYIINKLKIGKSPGYDLISNKILRHLPKKTIILLTYIYNSMLRLSYFPLTWKFSIIILIHKHSKPKNLTSSYRPISLLPTLAKIFEKIILKRIRPIIKSQNIIPHSQFGFSTNHSTIQQIHRLTDQIATSFEKKEFCPGVFLDFAQAFDRVWHIGLLYKLKLFLPAPYYLLIRSYLCNRSFAVRQGNSFSSYFSIQAGVPQGSDLAPDLFNIYTSDIPKVANTTIATYADDTAILASNTDLTLASSALQNHLDLINSWATQWRIKINPEKSYNVIFSLRKNDFPPLQLQGVDIPKTSQVKYLGLILDKRLTWGPHLKSKRKTLNNRLHLLRPILKSKMSIHTKSVLYKSLLRPIWAYGMQIWGCAKPSQIRSIQAFQSISLRLIASAPWYITNKALHKDLKIDTVDQLAQNYYAKFHVKLRHHPNPLISHLSSHTLPDNPPRRLKRRWCRDLLN